MTGRRDFLMRFASAFIAFLCAIASFADDVSICAFGAKEGLFGVDPSANASAVRRAVEKCAASGGGEVRVPKGLWRTGPVQLVSNVRLRLDEGAFLVFEDDPMLCLPPVRTSWEGVECMSYSPLVYAFGCTNVGIVGKGTLAPKMDRWRKWFVGGEVHGRVRGEMYAAMMRGDPPESRVLSGKGGYFRPHLVQFNRCRGVELRDFSIRESPFWTIHLLRCDGVVVSGIDSRALGHNSDGINIEKSRNVVVRDCRLHQGDDGVVVKAGRNRDGWDGSSVCANIDIGGVKLVEGHGLLVIGSELSGGVSNVVMRDSSQTGSSFALFSLKTNERRGGFVRDVLMENCRSDTVRDAVRIDTSSSRYPYPTSVTRRTEIDGIVVRNCSVGRADSFCRVSGDPECVVKGLRLENLQADCVASGLTAPENCPGFFVEGCLAGCVSPERAKWEWNVPKPWYAEYDAAAELPDAAALAAVGEIGDFRLRLRASKIVPGAVIVLRGAAEVALTGEVGAVAGYRPLYDARRPGADFADMEVILHRRAVSVKVNGFEVVCNERLGEGFPDCGGVSVRGADCSCIVLEPILGQKY